MTLEKCYSQNDNDLSIKGWNENALVWNDLMGKDGSSFQHEIVDKALKKLLPNIKGIKILEVACGNGFLSNRLAQEGAIVTAFDSSEEMIAFANQTNNFKDSLTFFCLDATKEESYQKFERSFDLILCNMALMDISSIDIFFEQSSKLLSEYGYIVITQTHPCFEKAVGPIFQETSEGNGRTNTARGIKVSKYLSDFNLKVRAIPQLPKEHFFFHRSLSSILQTGFKQGLVLDGFEEIAFPKTNHITEHNGWHLLEEIPVIVGLRFKKL